MLAAGLFVAGALGLLPYPALAYEVEIGEREIQAEVTEMFPIRQQLPFLTATFSDPAIRIVAGSDHIRLAVRIHVRVANEVEAAGRAEIGGTPGYDQASGEFHLVRPQVTDLRIEGLQQDTLELVRLMANAIAEQYLPNIVIHRLDERDFRQGMMRRKLRAIEIRDGKLIADLDW